MTSNKLCYTFLESALIENGTRWIFGYTERKERIVNRNMINKKNVGSSF
jgi:hypothetical protein